MKACYIAVLVTSTDTIQKAACQTVWQGLKQTVFLGLGLGCMSVVFCLHFQWTITCCNIHENISWEWYRVEENIILALLQINDLKFIAPD